MFTEVRSHEVSEAISRCARALEAGVEEHTIAVTQAIHLAIEEFDDSRAVTAHTLGSTRSTFHAFCTLLRVQGVLDFHAPPEAAAIARAYARRGFPLPVLVRCYQLGHGEMWRCWEGVVRMQQLPAEVELEVLTRSSRVLFQLIETLTTEVTGIYERERRQWARSMAAVREDAIKSLLAEGPVDTAAAERALAYDLNARHVGVVLWTTTAGGVAADLETSWRKMLDELGIVTSTAIAAGSQVLWGWFAQSEDQSVPSLRPQAGTRIAIGEPEVGLDGFRSSHLQALHARRVAALGPPTGSVVRFADVAVPALVTVDDQLGRIFVRHELGGVAGTDKLSGRLRDTLAAYFAERESPGATARRLGVHVNTVHYRLKQAEDVLGFAPADRRLELELALLLFERLVSEGPPRS